MPNNMQNDSKTGENKDFQAIILAAGKGSRMGSDLPKVLLPVCGRPMLMYVISALSEVGIERPVVVVGTGGDAVEKTIGQVPVYVRQEEQLGSGHAVVCAGEAAANAANIVVMCGDSPLFRTETVRSLMAKHLSERPAVTLTSAVIPNPTGYGRILRDTSGEVCGVAEEKLATDEQKRITEVNGGCYAFDGRWLWANIELMRKNEAGEYCLTEMVDVAISQGRRVVTVPASPDEILGANTPAQLKVAENILRARGVGTSRDN